jgi:hypothetical protein
MEHREQGLAFELLEREKILVSYQGNDAQPAQWENYLELMGTLTGVASLRFLVYAEGSPPSAALQRRIVGLVRGHSWRVALVSSSAALRFVVSTFALVNRSIRYFTPEQLAGALLHIGCSAQEAIAVERVLHRLRGV